MNHAMYLKLAIISICFLFSGQTILADETQEIIRKKVEHVRQFKEMYIADESISGIFAIPALYEQREFRPAWTNKDNIDGLIKLIEEMDLEGLNPEDYHLSDLKKMRNEINNSQSPPANLIVDYDIMLTDALVRIVYHIIFGKVDPDRLDKNWNIYDTIDGQEAVTWLQTAIDSPDIFQLVKTSLPDEHFFVVLRKALKKYRSIKAQGGWSPILSGQTIKPGDNDQRITLIRKRLIMTGDLSSDNGHPSSSQYDENLEKAVKDFQRRHGLSDDGKIGKNTIAVMNVSVDDRIDQIRVNLERGRWIYRDISSEFILVNIASFTTNYIRSSEVDWRGKSQVGKNYRRTPIFKADLKYLVINPTWTVPPTILKKDILPAIMKDISYLKRKNMKVLNRSGKVIDPATIDWKKYSGGNFPYIIRQDPGPSNALGRIKFIFPNEHFVFLHDTPSKSLFSRDMRAFSSGCIRVQNPAQLAAEILNDPEKWSIDKINAQIKSKETKTVYLDRKIPVLLLYATAFPADRKTDTIAFREDIYERDQAILEGLKGEFKRKKRHMDPSLQ